jgi:hypothetical protein
MSIDLASAVSTATTVLIGNDRISQFKNRSQCACDFIPNFSGVETIASLQALPHLSSPIPSLPSALLPSPSVPSLSRPYPVPQPFEPLRRLAIVASLLIEIRGFPWPVKSYSVSISSKKRSRIKTTTQFYRKVEHSATKIVLHTSS